MNTGQLFCLLLGGLVPASIAFSQTVPLSQDTYVVSQSPINYGSAATLNVSGTANASALVRFDLSSLPAGTTELNIGKATFTLFAGKVGPWMESTSNGVFAPFAGPALASTYPISAANAYYSVDVTQAVKFWPEGAENDGLIAPLQKSCRAEALR